MSRTPRSKPPARLPVEVAVIVRAIGWRRAVPKAAALCRRAARAAVARAARGRASLRKALAERGGEIGIVLAGDAFVARLNRDYRGKPEPTNVLSFASGEAAPEGPLILGDVAIALETARREAKAAGKPLAHHLAHLVVHGVLHVLGYDHERARDAARMEALEVEILETLGIGDPYRAAKPAKVA